MSEQVIGIVYDAVLTHQMRQSRISNLTLLAEDSNLCPIGDIYIYTWRDVPSKFEIKMWMKWDLRDSSVHRSVVGKFEMLQLQLAPITTEQILDRFSTSESYTLENTWIYTIYQPKLKYIPKNRALENNNSFQLSYFGGVVSNHGKFRCKIWEIG